MKLRTKLYLSFCIMIILPIAMCSLAVYMIFCMQKDNISETYDVNDEYIYENFFSPITIYGRITDRIYDELKEKGYSDPSVFEDINYIKQVEEELEKCLSNLVIKRNGDIIYSAVQDLSLQELLEILPVHKDNCNYPEVGTYRGGEHQKLIKQLEFEDDNSNIYNVYIVTSLMMEIPQVRKFFSEVVFSIVLVLLFTATILSIWIYKSMVSPLSKLKLATNNIKNGNMEFKMPVNNCDEIGEVFNDFEEMRVILKKASEEKLASDAEEKELIRNISHDLKTPLTTIKGYVEGILDGVAATPEKQQKYLKIILNKVNDMSKLIDELTIYSRLDANRVPYSFSKINIRSYFDDCYDEIKTELDAAEIELDYNYRADVDMYTMADPEQIKRVVNNIISNSVKYMADRKGHIIINIYDEGEYIHIEIADNGKGIPCKDLDRIFERFYRTDASRNSKQGGSGIGLAIVKKIIEDHKGKIWAESVEGDGTTMHINLRKFKH